MSARKNPGGNAHVPTDARIDEIHNVVTGMARKVGQIEGRFEEHRKSAQQHWANVKEFRDGVEANMGILMQGTTHAVHHQYVEALLKKEERRAARAEAIKTKLGGWMIITMLGAIGTATYNISRPLLRKLGID